MCVGVPTLTPAPCTNPSASLALRSSLPAQPAVLPPHLLLPIWLSALLNLPPLASPCRSNARAWAPMNEPSHQPTEGIQGLQCTV
jgi:hypothetical protein